MNDLRPLRDYHDAQPDPAPHDVARMRARLAAHTNAQAAPRGARRRVRPVWGLALAGAVAAGTLAVVQIGDAPGDGPGNTPVRLDSAQTVLLAAARRAETAPTGTYWHIKTTHNSPGAAVSAQWITLDGRRWTAYRDPAPGPGEAPSGIHRLKGLAPMPVSVLGPDPSLSALLKLPTDPQRLRALAERNRPKSGGPHYVTEALIELLISQPTTPKTRAAAFRALAAMPGVRSLGRTSDPRGRKGAALAFTFTGPKGPTEFRLIVDTGSSQVLARTFTRAKGHAMNSSTIYLSTGWTDEKPRIP
ncbi:CU044_5270 family protein [Actinomadura kijaniata]|uniref:CU044_5270 family protein n=1 Tax=Actinomadura namibiensis TaxID=182080 RepID=A0A7W3QSB0_ACTNM|nr:CU044_5270 family protein [Actinomadura namibiensis]MBA8957536.1 hypothetical protein [Actinomadura namibiensis]